MRDRIAQLQVSLVRERALRPLPPHTLPSLSRPSLVVGELVQRHDQRRRADHRASRR